MNFRIGMGFDVHELEKGHSFYLGGVELKDAPHGAVGHSDADVLIHALCDALLGATNLRDIGFHFSNKDATWRGADSKIFLKEVVNMLLEKGWLIGNVDCTICLEAPKINPHIPEMQLVLAPILKVDADCVSIKATTNEKLGYVGREEGVCAYAVALIYRVGLPG
jgi:2-C-methyl-D-erythritol 2,4-cyclodiphosphate synthase